MTRSAAARCLAAAALLGLAGCINSPAAQDWFGELGASIDEGGFGDPTANNIAIHSGEKTYVANLARRFENEVPSTITFEFNSARLDAAAIDVLRRQADWIRQFPEVRFRVYGHADAVGSSSYNRSLGRRRAEAVVAFFATQGISRERLEALVSFGEDQPVVATQERERRNRRTVTEVSGFVSNNPLVLDGKYALIVYRGYVASAGTSQTSAGAETSGTEALGQ